MIKINSEEINEADISLLPNEFYVVVNLRHDKLNSIIGVQIMGMFSSMSDAVATSTIATELLSYDDINYKEKNIINIHTVPINGYSHPCKVKKLKEEYECCCYNNHDFCLYKLILCEKKLELTKLINEMSSSDNDEESEEKENIINIDI